MCLANSSRTGYHRTYNMSFLTSLHLRAVPSRLEKVHHKCAAKSYHILMITLLLSSCKCQEVGNLESTKTLDTKNVHLYDRSGDNVSIRVQKENVQAYLHPGIELWTHTHCYRQLQRKF